MKGDRHYVLTYYKKTLLERMEDYKKLIPVLSVFGSNEDARLETKQEIDNLISGMSTEDQQGLLKSLLDGKNPSKG